MPTTTTTTSSTRSPRRIKSKSGASTTSKHRDGAVRYYYTSEAGAKSKTSVSVSTVPQSDQSSVKHCPKLQAQRSASTSQAASSTHDDKERKKAERRGSLLGSMFRSPSSVTASSRTRTAECLTCGSDDVPVGRTAKLHCGHRMCNSCLRRIFNMSVSDPQHMPPKCCGPDHIPLKHVEHLFDTKFKVLWNKKYEEYTTKNRMYCPSRGCGQWIKPKDMHKSHGRKYGRCPKCRTKVCTQCNAKWHSSGECPKDEDTNRLVEIAKQNGWQRCYNCRAMVELKEGCNHMTCRCTAQFCMRCASPWKTCDCPWFNYTNISDQDRLNHMRIPQEIPRRAPARPIQTPRNDRIPARPIQTPRNDRDPALTYQQEIDARQRQERTDEALARRLQYASLHDPPRPRPRPQSMHIPPPRPQSIHIPPPPRPRPRPRRNSAAEEIFGNQGEHFLNDNFVQDAANIVIGALGDASFARRGERESGRRSRRVSAPLNMDPGLAPNAFGTESMLDFAPPRPAAPPLRRTSTLRDRLGSISKENGRDRIGGWLNRLG